MPHSEGTPKSLTCFCMPVPIPPSRAKPASSPSTTPAKSTVRTHPPPPCSKNRHPQPPNPLSLTEGPSHPAHRTSYNNRGMSWFKRPTPNFQPDDDGEPNGDSNQAFGAESTFAPVSDDGEPARIRTEGLWVKCPSCRTTLFK